MYMLVCVSFFNLLLSYSHITTVKRGGVLICKHSKFSKNKKNYFELLVKLTHEIRTASVNTPNRIEQEMQIFARNILFRKASTFPLFPSCLAIIACSRPTAPHGTQQRIVDITPNIYQHLA